MPSSINFSKATAALIDANLDFSRVGLDDVELVRLSVLLQLVSVDAIAAQLQLEPEQVIEMFGLERVLTAIENGSGNT